MRAPRPRSLPLVPTAEPARRHLPLADDVRAIDRRVRPICAVWEITLACDLACRHCGSRAGRDRPGELSTEECLDLVDQMAELGVKEVSLIGGEAYLRDDWTEIVRHIRRRGMTALLTAGGAASRASVPAPRRTRVSRPRACRLTAMKRRTIDCAASPAATAPRSMRWRTSALRV